MNNENYTEINKTYEKQLIFRIGQGAGFFSEYNNMVFAIAYCLNNKIKFRLFSKNANFGFKNGWTDYFQPFCEEVYDDFHEEINVRQKFPRLSIVLRVIVRSVLLNKSMDRFQWKMIKISIKQQWYRRSHKIDFFTSDLWSEFTKYSPYFNSSTESVFFQNDLFEGNLNMLLSEIIEMTWKYNLSFSNEINSLRNELNLPSDFLGLHIRAGDKITEDEVFEFDNYFKLLIDKVPFSEIRDIFILTDDYGIIEKVKVKYLAFNIYTLCQPYEKGYINSDFNNLSENKKKEQFRRLFLSIDILNDAKVFVGVINSNPGMYLKLRRTKPSYFVDKQR